MKVCLAIGLILITARLGSHWLCAADYEVAYARVTAGYWQVWVEDTRTLKTRQITFAPTDKRFLRTLPGERKVYYRDNQGKLFSLEVRTPGEGIGWLPEVEVIKDFDVHANSGFLISTYAPNANDNVRIWWYSADGLQKRLLIAEPYLNEIPRWIPKGNSFLFVKSHGGNSAIFRSGLQATDRPALWQQTREAQTDAAPDPSGERVAYCREINGFFHLWLADDMGRQPRELYAGPGMAAEPAWSPDGQWIFFSAWDGAHFRTAKIKPDGSGFAFLSPEKCDSRYPACVAIVKGDL